MGKEVETQAGYISPEERLLISKLRENVRHKLVFGEHLQSLEDQNLFLVRWLRARDLNLEKATAMLLNNIEWRKENDVANALTRELDPLIKQQFTFEFAGVDNQGRPIVLLPLGKYDTRIVVEQKKFAEFDHFVASFFESIMGQIRKCNENRQPGQLPITQFTFICNLRNYPYSQILNLEAFKKILYLASVYEAHYPEVLYKAYIINCPFFMNMIMSLLRTVTAKRTMDKIVVFKSDSDWKGQMETFLDPKIIPEEYGGTLIRQN